MSHSQISSNSSLEIWLLGPFRIAVAGEPVDDSRWPSYRKPKQLIKILALQTYHRMHREQLIELLWPDLDYEAADNNLRKAIHMARRALEPSLSNGRNSTFVVTKDKQVILQASGELWIDTVAFEKRAADALKSSQVDLYETALALYQGDLLTEDLYEDWLSQKRESLRAKYQQFLFQSANLYKERGQYQRSIEKLNALIMHERTHEEAHRELMLLYALTNNRQLALRQYQLCYEAMSQELDAEPDPQTRELHEQIATGKIQPLSKFNSQHEDGYIRITDISTGAGPQFEPKVVTDVYPVRSKETDQGSSKDFITLNKSIFDKELTDSTRNNLPHSITSFIGRKREIEEIKNLLSQTRLLTLTGVGGVGKTRLAIEVASGLLSNYRDGVWFVELVSLGDATHVPQAVSAVLGVREEKSRSLLESLIEFLKLKKVLLVLDNCEHLISSCAELVEPLLRACPLLSVLATSRELLGLLGERIQSVPPLTTPELDELIPFSELDQYESIKLFVERVRLIQPDFSLTDSNAMKLATLCARLDGIPLAIELAASRARVLSIEQMLTMLNNRFRLLTGGNRASLPKHQTLRATVDWSYRLLNENEKRLFRRLSIFEGGWTLDAAEEVCAGEGIKADEVFELLTRLVEKSLVMAEMRSEEVRYRLLETVQQYGREKLVDAGGEAERFYRLHDEYFLELAERADQAYCRGEENLLLTRLMIEQDNMRLALERANESNNVELGLKICGSLWHFYGVLGNVSEGRGWLEKFLESAESRNVSEPVQAKALHRAGNLARVQSDYISANEYLQKSLSLYRQLGDKDGVAYACSGLGTVALHQGELDRASEFFSESLNLWRETGNSYRSANALNNLGLVAMDQGEYESAKELFEEALMINQTQGVKRPVAGNLSNLAEIAMYQGDFNGAESLYEKSLALSHELGYKLLIARILSKLAEIATHKLDYEKATRLYCESMANFREIGDKRDIAFCLEGMAEVALAQNQLLKATELFGAAESLRDSIEVSLLPEQRKDRDKKIEGLRSKLGETAFRKAWAAKDILEKYFNSTTQVSRANS